MVQQRLDKVKNLKAFLRSEEHTSELQSRPHLVCRLLLEKKKISSDAPSTNKTRSFGQFHTLSDLLAPARMFVTCPLSHAIALLPVIHVIVYVLDSNRPRI